MFWSIFWESLALIILIVVIGQVIATVLGRRHH
jgi:hypothetical protein